MSALQKRTWITQAVMSALTFFKRGPAECAAEAAAFLKGVNNTDTL